MQQEYLGARYNLSYILEIHVYENDKRNDRFNRILNLREKEREVNYSVPHIGKCEQLP